MSQSLGKLAGTIERDGFAFVQAPQMRALLGEPELRDWESFAASWNDLGVDAYMADGGRYRRRRFAALRATPMGILRKPHQPHYQSQDYNPLNGGVERWFEPVTDAVAGHPALNAILRTSHELFDRMTPAAVRPDAWHVELHQFRIEARPGQAGRPTPEGMHRDGVDWVLVLMVRRENIASGETTIYDLAKRPLGSFTLTRPLDSALVDDSRVFHGVTAVEPLDRRLAIPADSCLLPYPRGRYLGWCRLPRGKKLKWLDRPCASSRQPLRLPRMRCSVSIMRYSW